MVIFRLFPYTECPLDAQHLTEAHVAVEDLDVSLAESSIEAVEELLFIPNLRGLTLNVVSDHVSPLSTASPPPVAGVGSDWSLSLVCSGSCCVYIPSLHRSPSMISRPALIPRQCQV